jgi:dihydroflavonol-4-reductase
MGELWHRVTGRPVLLSLATVKLIGQEADRSRYDHSKTTRELGMGFRPVEETLADEIAWYGANGYLPEAFRRAAVPLSFGRQS